MPRYTVKSALNHDGKNYAIGDTVELTAEQAAAIPHAVGPLEGPGPTKAELDERAEAKKLQADSEAETKKVTRKYSSEK